ncbi:right-handed parallel beta-helix repeat-containing protein, partial [Oceanithermus sp.]
AVRALGLAVSRRVKQVLPLAAFLGSLALAASVPIQGHVYEDLKGTADSANSNFVARSGVRVYAYKDDGNGNPDANDTLVATATTDSNGAYELAVSPNATYWVVVDSKTVSPSAGFNNNQGQTDVWAEQTYGPAGSLCANPDQLLGNSSDDPYNRSNAGVCYGGRSGATSDDASSPTTAEHLAKATVGNADVSGLDFGFSFNVVTNTNDRDDDQADNRTAQGTLRQFIQNANAISGANTMRFVPAVAANGGSGNNAWWHIDLALDADSDGVVDILPPISDDSTTVDGTAYSYADGQAERDTNPGSVAGGVSVGTGPDGVEGNADDHYLEPFNLPELEVAGHDAGGSAGRASALLAVLGQSDSDRVDDVEIANLALYDQMADSATFTTNQAVSFRYAENGSAHDLLVGVRADGSEPADGEKVYIGVQVSSSSNVSISRSYIAYGAQYGISLDHTEPTSQITISDVEVQDSGYGHSAGDNIAFHATTGSTIRYTYSHGASSSGNSPAQYRGAGIEVWYGTSNSAITECLVTGSLYHGVTFNSSATYSQTEENRLEHSVIRNNHGPGVLIALYGNSNDGDLSDEVTRRIKISQNAIYDNAGLGIDIVFDTSSDNGDGVSPNDGSVNNQEQNNGQDYPVFTRVRLNQDDLELEGYIGDRTTSQYLSGDYTVEVFLADNSPADQNGPVELDAGGNGIGDKPHGEGARYIGSCSVTLQNGAFSCVLQGVA